ncbi:hypothetical protein HW555_009457 [Spodoptera exigua]|uniref:Uncharacterized protein n=1 Tax=Spodoptera exigua TaxID=7107 RepID=A0A835GCF2_SPOEX|nr:hypothetical protein HW555_009457 [Spodoptera exigua]
MSDRERHSSRKRRRHSRYCDRAIPQKWPSVIWKIQLFLNITQHRTTQYSALNLLVGIEAATPLIQSLVRDVVMEGSSPNREALREMGRQRASERLKQNQQSQDNHDDTFISMRGPYRVMKILPYGCYELQLLAGSYGKSTQAAAEFMITDREDEDPGATQPDEAAELGRGLPPPAVTARLPVHNGQQPSASRIQRHASASARLAAEVYREQESIAESGPGLSMPLLD